MMTFEAFVASRVAVADVNPIVIDLGGDPNETPTAGYVYDESYVIEKLECGYTTFWEEERLQTLQLEAAEQWLFDHIQTEDQS